MDRAEGMPQPQAMGVYVSVKGVLSGALALPGASVPAKIHRWRQAGKHNLTLPVVLSILLTVWGAIGFGLALGELALAFKQVSALVSLANYLSLTLSGALVPLDRLSFFVLLKLVWPMTWGIDLVRQAQAGSWSLADASLEARAAMVA